MLYTSFSMTLNLSPGMKGKVLVMLDTIGMGLIKYRVLIY